MDETKKEAFRVTDMASAEWVLERLAELDEERKQRDEAYKRMMERYKAWYDGENAKEASRRGYFNSLLDAWARDELKDSKKKSISLPGGTLCYRTGVVSYSMGGKAVTRNSAELLAFCEASLPDAVKVEKSVDWANVKKRLNVLPDGRVCTQDGEIIEGMTATQAAPTFYVRTGD